MRVVYIYGDQENIIEIKTSDFAKFLNGTTTGDQLHDLWIASGPLFRRRNNRISIMTPKESGTGPTLLAFS